MQEHASTGIPWRRIFAAISAIATILYVIIFFYELIDAAHEKFVRRPPPEIFATMSAGVAHQIDEVRSVNTRLLGDTLNNDLSTYNCTWYFACSARPHTSRFPFYANCPTCGLSDDSPRLLYWIGGFPIPTLHTVFGAPHALWITASKIVAAGPWAVFMFLSCTIIYFSLALLWGDPSTTKGEPRNPLFVLLIITVSPLAITLLANLFQWAATKALNSVSWAIGLLVTVFVYGAAIRLAVAVPHIWKAPHELAEASELIRKA